MSKSQEFWVLEFAQTSLPQQATFQNILKNTPLIFKGI